MHKYINSNKNGFCTFEIGYVILFKNNYSPQRVASVVSRVYLQKSSSRSGTARSPDRNYSCTAAPPLYNLG